MPLAMARPLRLEFPGVVYHVSVRVNSLNVLQVNLWLL